jgi:hypothetical protein
MAKQPRDKLRIFGLVTTVAVILNPLIISILQFKSVSIPFVIQVATYSLPGLLVMATGVWFKRPHLSQAQAIGLVIAWLGLLVAATSQLNLPFFEIISFTCIYIAPLFPATAVFGVLNRNEETAISLHSR